MTVSGSHFVLGDDLEKLSEDRLDWVTRLLPVTVSDTPVWNVFESSASKKI
jgi:hypothetical protein